MAAQSSDQKTVLVAPLNWGLGHASRSVPVIRTLLKNDCRVLLASDGESLELLKQYFPDLPAFDLPSYDVRYVHRSAVRNGIQNIPGIVRALWKEHRWIRSFCEDHRLDGIISDHRLGIRHPQISSLLIAHQLRIPFHNKWIKSMLTAIHCRLVNRFDVLWIPDREESQLSGRMSRSDGLKIPRHHIGYLSALEKVSAPMRYRWGAILSGPEPARTEFEREILNQFTATAGRHLLIRGTADKQIPDNIPPGVELFPVVSGEKLSHLISSTEYVVCRPGYSSIMDMIGLEQEALLVPTPGQPEQEYLAKRMKKLDDFPVQSQGDLNLNEAERRPGKPSSSSRGDYSGDDLLSGVVERWLDDL